MKKQTIISALSVFALFFMWTTIIIAQEKTTEIFREIEGKVIDAESHNDLVFADIVIEDSNISTVTNSDGHFALKIPEAYLNGTIAISYLGYEKITLPVSEFEDHIKIRLHPVTTALAEVSIVTTPKNAEAIVRECLSKKSSLYNNQNTLMTAFYRESIKKRRRNASLSEAVVRIHKKPYDNLSRDYIELVKARKTTDYDKLDTLALKLQGGPFSNLYTDMIKYPEYIFNNESIPHYNFNFDSATKINDRLIYVINFKQKEHLNTPLYYGKLFIDAETLALTNAVYSLNISNRTLSSEYFVRKKPRRAEVYPTETAYRVNYRTKNGKWHYAYSNISLTFKVNWEGKLFNSTYTLNSEMAVTDWEINENKLTKNRSQILRPTTILTEKASGFSDPRFWGAYNIIEPEKSIQSAIKKIQKQLKRT
ncbi:carboxypeptidase-like regulatory domain-containing protein [Tamlana sp. 2_MG-2023]|uniref:carboxypeptidase-like regulatory domain-containing protein n=1 Tax=unclassified Tamlana TaxID=2614803 RepID=UPI0026E22902|nr:MULTISPECIES: carboxypeptidase-like regulatory domain-containing protein [unclassified Tamlana]MDO6758991.1 carboxypeptidase-like regulatory domain-containing protein [Tamlana sp. 2_MG-2023]MDO6789690.1 carboxypeptidase-like regulatory domain-containing protein [Tamlana sp. 1_MG-2023]